MTRLASALLLFLPIALGCASNAGVTRMVGGHRIKGRFIADEAYAAYLEGVVLETKGQTEAALAAYAKAIEHDPDSAELWTRVGVLRCTDTPKPGDSTKSTGPWDAFTRASEIDPEYEETWTERARCHLKRGELDSAARAGKVAVSIDPSRAEAVILLALVLERRGRIEEARRWLDGLIAREPADVAAHEAMRAFAARAHDEPRRLASDEALSELDPSQRSRDARRSTASLSEIDEALVRGDLRRARQLAIAAHVSSGALALRATALGRVSFAREQAEIVLAADPADVEALTAAAVAADLSRDDAALARALLGVRPPAGPISALAALMMSELLARRIGPAAEAAWMRAAGAIVLADDPLVAAVSRRSRPRGLPSSNPEAR